jgi:hypothetical protein
MDALLRHLILMPVGDLNKTKSCGLTAVDKPKAFQYSQP